MAAQAPSEPVAYGGQAVVEGVMIRSPRFIAVACRLPQSDGSHGTQTPVDVHTEPVRSLFQRLPWLRRIPLLRGFCALFEMLSLGLRALERAANLQTVALAVLAPGLSTGDAAESPRREQAGALNGPILWATIGTAFALGLGLFVVLPNYLADLLANWLGLPPHSIGRNLIEGGIVLTMFVGYIGLIGQWSEIRRVFQYHGAEHKVVNAHEAGIEPTVAAVATQSCIHPRCGTNFGFLVIVVSIVVYSFLPWTPALLARLGMRLCCLPLVAGLGFELIRVIGRYRGCRPLQLLILPGLWLQRLSTREPSRDMIEVALASFQAVRLAEETDTLTSRVLAPGETVLA
ncbi:MAG: DUF1385 domain-containing protein [Phycisphaerales bacterium]|nr:DUF1385 domain-containing protein [Phycisphaerales bacterium]